MLLDAFGAASWVAHRVAVGPAGGATFAHEPVKGLLLFSGLGLPLVSLVEVGRRGRTGYGRPMRLIEAIDIHGDRLKAAVLEAGPAARVPNCPQWTVVDLVTHLTAVLSHTVALITDRTADPKRPEDWADALGCWDGQRLAVREALRRPPDTPVRSPFPHGDGVTVGDLARRLAHETAIHRLDAESALPRPPATRYAEAFAIDGVDEFLTFLAPRRAHGGNGVVRVSVNGPDGANGLDGADGLDGLDGLDSAAGTEAGGRTWTLVLRPDQAPAPGEGAPDVVVSGAADDVYRALWGRPHAARIVGDVALLEPLAAP